MPLRLDHMTERDPSLPHQVIFSVVGHGPIYISCNCRRKRQLQGGEGYDPMGVTADIEDSRMLYNDPSNHWIPFTEEDKAKW